MVRKEYMFYGGILTLCVIIGGILGGASLAYYVDRLGYTLSQCSVTNVEQKLVENCRYRSNPCVQSYTVTWSVMLQVEEANGKVAGTIFVEYPSQEFSDAAEKIHNTGSSSKCFYKPENLAIVWDLPYSDYQAIGIASLFFWAVALLCVATICKTYYIQRKDAAFEMIGDT